MKKLTENLIQQRLKTCTTDLDKVLQINITGRDLQDVSLLRQMTGVEILSLSVNHISSLSDFQFCKNLKELYLRNNNISDLNEITYLSELPKLKLLMLSQNPCSNDPLYRPTVIKNLQHLVELDGIPISLEERQKAIKSGIALNMESFSRVSGEKENCEETSGRRIPPSPPEAEKETEEIEVEVTGVLPNREASDTALSRGSDHLLDKMQRSDRSVTLVNGCIMCRDKESKAFHKKDSKMMKTSSSVQRPSKHIVCKFCNSPYNDPLLGLRIIQKNSNLLSATLSLIKELDYSSLQIVQVELTALMNAFEVEFVCQRKF